MVAIRNGLAFSCLVLSGSLYKKSTYLVEMSLHLYSLISPAKSLGVLCYNRYCKNLNNHVGELSVLIFSYVSK